MEITEVRVKLVQDSTERLKAFCSVTFDGEYVVRDLKIIEGTNGLFVAMPSRKLTDRCPKCGAKNHLRAKFCNECGTRLNENRAGRDAGGRTKLHADVAHPINAQCRQRIQDAIVEALNEEIERSKQPGYVPTNLDEDDYDSDDFAPAETGDSQDEDGGGASEYEELVADLRRERQQAYGDAEDAHEPEDDPVEPDGGKPAEPEAEPAPDERDDNQDSFSAGIL